MNHLYQFGQRPDCFSLPERVVWVIACAECAAAWLQPSYDYVKVQRVASEDCQICQYLAGLPDEVDRIPTAILRQEEAPRQLALFEAQQ